MKILLAIDGSPCSTAAVDEVARRPWPQGSTVKVLTAIESATSVPITPEAWALPPDYFEGLNACFASSCFSREVLGRSGSLSDG